MKRFLIFIYLALAALLLSAKGCEKNPQMEPVPHWHEVTGEWCGVSFSVSMPGEPVTLVNWEYTEEIGKNVEVIRQMVDNEEVGKEILDEVISANEDTSMYGFKVILDIKEEHQHNYWWYWVYCFMLDDEETASGDSASKEKLIYELASKTDGVYWRDTVISDIPRWVYGYDKGGVESCIHEINLGDSLLFILGFEGIKGTHLGVRHVFFSSFKLFE